MITTRLPVLLWAPLVLALALLPVSSAAVTSVATGNYTAGATWSDATAPSALNDYVISGFTVTVSGTTSVTLAGNSLVVKAGGILRRELTNNNHVSLTVPPFTLDGGTLQFRSNNTYARNYDFNSAIAVAAASTIQLGTGAEQYTDNAYLKGALTGAANLSYVGNGGNDANDVMNLHVTSANNGFSGNWSVGSIDTGKATLNAAAAKALGTGSVTLGTRGNLVVTSANGIDSLAGVSLTESSASLVLTNAWNNPLGRLTLTEGTLNLAASDSTIAAMTIAGNTVPTGTYTAADLTALGFGGTFLGTGTLAIAGASPSLAVAPTFTFSNNGLTGHYAVRVSNVAGNGTTPLLIAGVTAGGSAAGDVTNIQFPASVAAGAGADITFDFTPGAGSGTYTFDLLIASDDLSSPSPRTVAVEITVAPSPVLLVASSRSLTNNGVTTNYSVTISNSGADGITALTISGVAATGTDSGAVSNLIAPPSVAAGASDAVTFDFTPSHGAGSYSFSLEISSNDDSASSPRVVAVTVQVAPNPKLVVNPTFSFSNNGLAATYTIPMSNVAADGSTVLNISGVTVSGADSARVSNIGFPAVVAANTADSITFDFTPTDGPRTYGFNLEIASDDESAASPRVVAVTVLVSNPAIAVTPAAIDFGSFPAAPGLQTATLVVTNNGGTENLVVSETLTAISGSGSFAISAFPGAIPPGETRDLTITFDPGSKGGFFKGSLIIVSNDSNLFAPIVPLSAYVAPSGSLVAVDFGSGSSPLETGYERLVVAEGASKTIGGVGVRIASKNGDMVAYDGAGGGNLMTDGGGTTFNGGAGNYVSVQLTGLASGELNLISSQNYPNTLGLPLNVLFGELGGTLATIASNLNRPSTASHTATVVSGKTYELRIVENGNANLAYLSGLLLWGSAIPNGYDSFVTGAGLDPATTGAPGLDPDADGVPTGIEWAVGGSPNDPAAPDTAKLPTGVSMTADPDGDLTFATYLRFSYRRNDLAAADARTSITVAYGDDLAGWHPAVNGTDGVVIVESNDGFGTCVDRVDVYIPTSLAPSGHLFGRLRMVKN